MDELHTYRIEIKGRADENDLNTISPLQMTGARVEADSTFFTICTDQSGLIGLLRHLHTRGLMLLSVCREEENNKGE
jgi:hypothetical protein